jgi:hypothetical protein
MVYDTCRPLLARLCALAALGLLTFATAAPAQTSPLVRGVQSLNPDVSAIVDAGAGVQGARPGFIAGDDPLFNVRKDGRALGFAVQEVELAFSATVDPYFKGEVYLTIPNLSGLEVEEAVVTTTSLPGDLQLRAGSFRSAFGRQNGQHLHVQEFQLRPLVNAAFLGADGLRGPGAQLSWLVPAPFFLTLYLEGYSLSPPDDPRTFQSFGGDNGGLTGLAHAKAFFELTDETSLFLGLSGALGRTPQVTGTIQGAPATFAPDGDTALLGSDLYLKWKPANQAGGYFALSFQAEALLRHLPRLVRAQGGTLDPAWDGGLYAQLVAQLSRRISLGGRFDLLGIPSSVAIPRVTRESLEVTWQLSEFAKVRASAYGEQTGDYGGDANRFDGGQGLSLAGPNTSTWGVLGQLEISIGAHGAHAF